MSRTQWTLTASIPAILNGLAEEMSMLAGHGLQLEASIAGLAARESIDSGMVEDLQNLDLLLQHLLELRDFMTALAEGALEKDNLSIDRALGALKLGGLQARLTSAIANLPTDYSCAPAGECDLF